MLASCFSVRHHDALRELFALLGAPFSDTDSAANARTAKRLWLSEHRSLVAEYSDDLLVHVYDEFGLRLELVGENLPESEQAGRPKHRTNNLGGTVRAMIKRFRLEESGDPLGIFLCWAGQRLRDLKLGETVPELIQFVERENPAVLGDPWFKAELAKDDEHPDRYQRPFASETEIMILCAKVVYGDQLRLVYAEPTEEPSTIPGVPGRMVLYYQFSRPGRPDIIILNGAAVERTDGADNPIEPRPTSASVAREVAAIWGFEGTEGLMVSNPHSERLALEIDHTVRTLGFNPTFVVYGLPGPDVADNAAKVRMAKTILGEVARILNNEQKFAVAAS